MKFKQAIKEQWIERFNNDESYLDKKLKELEALSNYQELIYYCMNIDTAGLQLIANKIKLSHRDFALVLSVHRAMSQGNIYEGTNGFPYLKTTSINEKGETINYTYPDSTVDTLFLPHPYVAKRLLNS